MQQQQMQAANIRFTTPPFSAPAEATANKTSAAVAATAATASLYPFLPTPNTTDFKLFDSNTLTSQTSPMSSTRRGIDMVEDPKPAQEPHKQQKTNDLFATVAAAAARASAAVATNVPDLVSIPAPQKPSSNLKAPPPSSLKPPPTSSNLKPPPTPILDDRKQAAMIIPQQQGGSAGTGSSKLSSGHRKSSRVRHQIAPMNIGNHSSASYENLKSLPVIEIVVSDESFSGIGSVSTSATLKKMK